MLKANNQLFGHMILIALSRNLDKKAVFEHAIGPVPWSSANSDETMRFFVSNTPSAKDKKLETTAIFHRE